MKLFLKNGTQLKIGSRVKTVKDNAEVEIRAMYKPHHPNSTGRVLLQFDTGEMAEYYPAVIGAQWKEENE